MGRSITLDLPEPVYERLAERADREGRAPADLAAEWVRQAVRDVDPLIALSGTLEADATDLARRHDHYLGEALQTEIRRTDG